MGLIFCPDCNEEVSFSALACTVCGALMSGDSKYKSNSAQRLTAKLHAKAERLMAGMLIVLGLIGIFATQPNIAGLFLALLITGLVWYFRAAGPVGDVAGKNLDELKR